MSNLFYAHGTASSLPPGCVCDPNNISPSTPLILIFISPARPSADPARQLQLPRITTRPHSSHTTCTSTVYFDNHNHTPQPPPAMAILDHYVLYSYALLLISIATGTSPR